MFRTLIAASNSEATTRARRVLITFVLLGPVCWTACGDDDEGDRARDGAVDATRFDGGIDAGDDAGPPECFHDVCEEGDYLDRRCNACAAAICEETDICCGIRWDEGCVWTTQKYTECVCAPESNCTDLRDNDLDNAVDCGDSDCASRPECTAGSGSLGEPCDEHSDCTDTFGAPVCRTQAAGFPSGACSAFCMPGNDACGENGVCLGKDFGAAQVSLCWQKCDPKEEESCRDGYLCREYEGETVCQPDREDCDTEEDDDFDGAINCADRECSFNAICQEDCDDGEDDNHDGDVDCDDFTCIGKVECDDPSCSEPQRPRTNGCVELGGYVECNPITNEGCTDAQVCDLALGGYRCFEATTRIGLCGACEEHGCDTGTTCVGFGAPGPDPSCWQFCCGDLDCEEGSFCNKAITSQIISQPSHIGICAVDYSRGR